VVKHEGQLENHEGRLRHVEEALRRHHPEEVARERDRPDPPGEPVDLGHAYDTADEDWTPEDDDAGA
jgi:hypothetical protein